MSAPQHVAIVGAGAAGASAARTLRRCDYAGKISLVDIDPAGSYERPPLTKTALMDTAACAHDFALLPVDELEALNIDPVFDKAIKQLDAETRSLTLQSGETIVADKVLLATGREARGLNIEGGDAQGVYTLRDFADLEAIRQVLTKAKHITVIGGGLIGAECVASLLKLGKQVC